MATGHRTFPEITSGVVERVVTQAAALLRRGPATEPVSLTPAPRKPDVAEPDRGPREGRADLGVGLLGNCMGNLRDLAGWLGYLHMETVWHTQFATVRALARGPRPFSHLFIDVEQQGGIHKLLDGLWAFRLEVPDLPVILVSDAFSYDDFDLDRIWLADVCLRAASSLATVELALQMSVLNNRVWRGRCGLDPSATPSGAVATGAQTGV